MTQWNYVEKTKSSIDSCFELAMLRFVHPLKDREYKYCNSQAHFNNFIDYSYFQVAVHAIVEWRKSAACNKNTDSGVIKSTEYGVGFYF
jgi:hypothetical protein